jgi:hypothetical protein
VKKKAVNGQQYAESKDGKKKPSGPLGQSVAIPVYRVCFGKIVLGQFISELHERGFSQMDRHLDNRNVGVGWEAFKAHRVMRLVPNGGVLAGDPSARSRKRGPRDDEGNWQRSTVL